MKSDHARIRAWQQRTRKPLKKTPIKRVSAKKAKNDRLRGKQAKERNQSGFVECEIKSPICTHEADPWGHELVKRSAQGSTTDKKNRVHSCTQCNGYVEDHPDWAIVNGWSVSRTRILHEMKMGRLPGCKVTE